jgi:hydroxylysine kinase
MMVADDLLKRFDGGGDDAVTKVSGREVARILEDHWSIRGKVRSLVAERDEVLEVEADDGRHLVLKIYSAAESPKLADLRARACVYIAVRDPSLPVPAMIPTGGDVQALADMTNGARRVVQLMTFLDGMPQVDAPRSRKQAWVIGQTLARTAHALRDFEHQADRRRLVWDLANASDIQVLLPSDRSGCWQSPAGILRRFQDQTAEMLARLPSQVVHNDFNGHNLLMDPRDATRITGIIDFGDVARSQRINDVAIAACYQLRLDEEGFSGAVDVAAGYHSLSPLHQDEVAILPALILVRLAMAVTITEFRAARMPHRATEILKNTGYAWRALGHLGDLNLNSAADQFFAACDKEIIYD